MTINLDGPLPPMLITLQDGRVIETPRLKGGRVVRLIRLRAGILALGMTVPPKLDQEMLKWLRLEGVVPSLPAAEQSATLDAPSNPT